MEPSWDEDQYLLLIYRDEMADRTIAASPLTSPSKTIALHRWSANPGRNPEDFGLSIKDLQEESRASDPVRPGQDSLFSNLSTGDWVGIDGRLGIEKDLRPIPLGCSVWGWWRKPWEVNTSLLTRLKAVTRHLRPKVLLYNQYVHRLYHATLVDLYFSETLTSVVCPPQWLVSCPQYYRRTPHLCGAFFVLKIEESEADAKILGADFYIDSATFGVSHDSHVIPTPSDIGQAIPAIIDRNPNRINLRTVERTILVVRSYPQKEKTASLLREDVEDVQEDLPKALGETKWPDVLSVLRSASPSAWRKLATNQEAIKTLGERAQIEGSRLTRLDFWLFASAVTSPHLRPILETSGRDDFTGLGVALRCWVTEDDEERGRVTAAKVFAEAWGMAQGRYNLAELPNGYFERLPAVEAIAAAVKHDIGKKFYRDHLSHNVRAALLSARLIEERSIDLGEEVNGALIGFLSGLLHDLALPLTTFPKTVSSLAEALREAQHQPENSQQSIQPHVLLLDQEILRRSLSYVALLASVQNVPHSIEASTLRPWEDRSGALQLTDAGVLIDELLCAISGDHALISAALIFDYAVHGAKEHGDFDSGVKTLFPRMTGSDSTPEGRELACILQCIALHDRRAAAEHHGVLDVPTTTPQPISIQDFTLPSIVAIADELQEWGRSLGKPHEIGAIDADIRISESSVRAIFTMSNRAATFESVRFCLLEYLLGKFKTIGRIRITSAFDAVLSLTLKVTNLTAFHLVYVCNGMNSTIKYKRPVEQLDFSTWPKGGNLQREVTGSNVSHLVAFQRGSRADDKRDFLNISGDGAYVEEFVKWARMNTPLESLSIEAGKVVIRLKGGYKVWGKPLAYRFGKVSASSIPATVFPPSGRIGHIELSLQGDNSSEEEMQGPPAIDPQKTPHPHFLDFDWRFTSQTAVALVDAARHHANGNMIGYLGCPTLALWHARRYPEEENWLLLDRGHFSLAEWLDNQIPRSQYEPLDVFNDIPTKLLGRFSLVLTDPPWYDPHYESFWRTAYALLTPKGVLGVSHYPRSLDERKFEWFRLKLARSAARAMREFGAIEIDYDIPEFESAANGLHRKFMHPALGVYRPGFMDFYRMPDEKLSWEDKPRRPLRLDPASVLTHSISLDEGHHLRCRPVSQLTNQFPLEVEAVRRGIKRLTRLPDAWIAWSSRNLIVRKAATTREGDRLESLSDLAKFVIEKEQPNADIHTLPE